SPSGISGGATSDRGWLCTNSTAKHHKRTRVAREGACLCSHRRWHRFAPLRGIHVPAPPDPPFQRQVALIEGPEEGRGVRFRDLGRPRVAEGEELTAEVLDRAALPRDELPRAGDLFLRRDVSPEHRAGGARCGL